MSEEEDKRDQFLIAVQRLHIELDAMTHVHGMKGEAVNIMLTGILDYDSFGEPVLKAVFSIDVHSEEVLQEAMDFMMFNYESNEYSTDEEEEYESENWWKSIFDDWDDSPENLN
jgi:hypothetical protein